MKTKEKKKKKDEVKRLVLQQNHFPFFHKHQVYAFCNSRYQKCLHDIFYQHRSRHETMILATKLVIEKLEKRVVKGAETGIKLQLILLLYNILL